MVVHAVARLLVAFTVLPFPASSAAAPLAGAAGAALREDDSAASVQLLQVRAQRAKPLVFSGSATTLLESARPLAWVHIPKCGSSFANSFIHTPGLCPSLPPDTVINRTMFCRYCNKYNEDLLKNFRSTYNLDTFCPGSFTKWGVHEGVGSKYEQQYRGHGVMMLRQPEQRLISSFFHHQHDWPHFYPLPPPPPPEYARVLQGCMVKTLTRDFDRTDPCGSALPSVLPGELDMAKERLRTLAFVGLTEEWALSICLFRAMFGGLCYGSDFEDVRLRPGTAPPTKDAHPTDMLEGFVDKYDGELYEHARDLFANNTRKYGISNAACQPCYDHAATHWAP